MDLAPSLHAFYAQHLSGARCICEYSESLWPIIEHPTCRPGSLLTLCACSGKTGTCSFTNDTEVMRIEDSQTSNIRVESGSRDALLRVSPSGPYSVWSCWIASTCL